MSSPVAAAAPRCVAVTKPSLNGRHLLACRSGFASPTSLAVCVRRLPPAARSAAPAVQAVAVPVRPVSAANTQANAMPKDAPLPSLYPPEPKPPAPGAPKLRVAIIGAGLAGMSTAIELLDQGHSVELYESRSFIGGKVASFKDKDGNHIEMGLHVFFGCYFNLFRLMAKVGAVQNLLVKDHTHTFVNKGGDVRELDFRFLVGDVKVGAPLHGLKAFFTTQQLSVGDRAATALALATSPIVRALVDPEGGMSDIRSLDGISFEQWFKSHGGSQGAIDRMWNPIAYALGFLDCRAISARCMLTIFQFFATKTDASVLRMLAGSPDDRLHAPLRAYIEARGGKFHLNTGGREILYEEGADGAVHVTGIAVSKAQSRSVVTADAYVAALDVPGIKKLLPAAWRRFPQFDRVYKLEGVPVTTVQLRYDGWVTELQDPARARAAAPAGIDNLLYSADAHFSCFADLALTSPWDYYKEGQGSLLQCVLSPGYGEDPKMYMPLPNEEVVRRTHEQAMALFPSARGLKLVWSSVVKIAQSLYREAPGLDSFRPDQATPVSNFFLAGSYTKQDYIDSMEGATLSGRQCAARIGEVAAKLEGSGAQVAAKPA